MHDHDHAMHRRDAPPRPVEPARNGGRSDGLDALRGLLLVLMTLSHLPTVLAQRLGQPLGYVSAAEGFVLLSAVLAGWVFTQRARRVGVAAMRQGVRQRALQVYVVHLALLLLLCLLFAPWAAWRAQPAVTDLAAAYLAQPLQAWLAALVLVYQPALLDILPMYVLFLLATPWLLPGGTADDAAGSRAHWAWVLAGSLLLWAAAQAGLGGWLHVRLLGFTGWAPRHMGAFHLLAWQLLWVCGLWAGWQLASGGAAVLAPQQATEAAGADQASPGRRGSGHLGWRALLALAWVVAVTGLLWRHAVGQVPWPGASLPNLLFDKWQLGPLRLLNLLAWVVLVVHHGPALVAWLQAQAPMRAALRALAVLGRHGLAVFSAHVAVVLLALTLRGAADPAATLASDVAVAAASLAALWAVALSLQRRSPHGRAAQQPATSAR